MLDKLHEIFDENLDQIGIQREDRPFTPHLTLGRRRQGICIPPTVQQQLQAIECGQFLADRVILYQSHLEAARAVHTPLRTVFFNRPGP